MFNPFGQVQNYDDVERRRMAGYGLMQGGAQAGSPLGALSSIFGALMSRNADKHEKRIATDEKTAEIEKRAQFGQRLLSGMGDNPEMKLVADLLNSNIPEYQQMGVERALAANKPKTATGIDAAEFFTKHADQYEATPEQFAKAAEDNIITGQELGGWKRKPDQKSALEHEKLKAQIAKENALAAKAGRGPAPQAPQLPGETERLLERLPPELREQAIMGRFGVKPESKKGDAMDGITTNANFILDEFESMLDEEKVSTGPVAGRLGGIWPGDDRQTWDAMTKQLVPEFKKIQRAVGEGVFSNADLQLLAESMPSATNSPVANKNVIRMLRNKIATVTGQTPPGASARPPSGPQIGEVQDGHRYKGGDPADPASWEAI